MRARHHPLSPANQQASLTAFLAAKAKFDAALAELQAMSEGHFGTDPEAILWGETASLNHWTSRLTEVTDAFHKRGEYAE